MIKRLLYIMIVCLGLDVVSVNAAQPIEPMVVKVVGYQSLKPEGGTLKLTLAFTKNSKATVAGNFVLSPTFTDGWGRVFWSGDAVTIVPGDAAKPATVEFAIPYPPLPAGRYLFRGMVRDAAGADVQTVSVPVGRIEKFDFRRDLVWLYWAGGPVSDAMAKTVLDIGMNGAGGVGADYRFPYGFFRDHAAHVPIESYPEETVRHPEGTDLGGFRNWITPIISNDGGMALILMTDEVPSKLKSPAMRAVRLRLLRSNPFLNVPTVSSFNKVFESDILSWDEVLRDGFTPLKNPEKIKYADRELCDVEMPAQRMAVMRGMQTPAVFTPGATHCLYNSNYDSFNSRAYNYNTTLDCATAFVQSQAHYGLRPGNKLVNLRVGLYRNGELLGVSGQHEHLYWAALACNNRMFIIYGPGDGFGGVPATRDGQVTADGRYFQEVRRTIHGLRPVILETRTLADPAVLVLMNHYNGGEQNYVEGLLNCGIMPRGGLRPDDANRLIFAIKSPLDTAMPFRAPGGLNELQDAVRRGAGLVLQGNYANELARLGIKVSPPDGSVPATAGEIDLTPLAASFPGLAGVKVLGKWGPGAVATPESGLKPIYLGDKLLALTGPLGKGWVLYLNFELQDMFRLNGLTGSGSAGQLSLLVDSTIPDRNAAFVRALLARAGVPQRINCTDAKGRVHPYLRAFRAETYDARQEYLYIVSEAAGKLAADPADAKKQVVTLASEPQVAGRLRILNPAVKAVRDLRAKKMLPVQTDAQGAWVDINLEAGQGTILSLLTSEPTGSLALRLSQSDVVGNEQVQVELKRVDAAGKLMELAGHSLWVRLLDPQGREVEPLTRWATGGGPHLFTIPFALNDPEGEWTVVAEDMTDGTCTQAKLQRQSKPAGPRQAFLPSNPPVHSPFTVTLESTPYLDGDLIVTEIRGTLKCVAAGPTPVTIRLPAGPAGAAREVTVTSPKANTEVPFALPLWMTRAQAQAVCGLRYDGVELTVTAPGMPTTRFRYVPNILPLARAPQRIGSLTGGKLAVKINNFTQTEQRVAISLATLPGENGKAWQASKIIAPQSTGVLERAVAELPVLSDPGLYNVALEWRVGDAAQERAALAVETVYEQEWWVKVVNPLEKLEQGGPGDQLAPADEEASLAAPKDEAPMFPDTPTAREKAGWRRVVTQGVVWWADVAPPKFTVGQVYVATQVAAPKDMAVRVAFLGPSKPTAAWVNGALLAKAPASASAPKPKDKSALPAPPLGVPSALKAGKNVVVVQFDVKPKDKDKPVGCSLAMLDPTTGKRDSSLQIGTPLSNVGGK
jgi:hypothetical protein